MNTNFWQLTLLSHFLKRNNLFCEYEIIPLQLIENIDTMNIGKKIKVKVNATRIKFNANQIQIVGTIIE